MNKKLLTTGIDSFVYKYSSAAIRRLAIPIFRLNSFLLSKNQAVLSQLFPFVRSSRRYLFIPYRSPDCLSLYRGLASYVSALNATADILDVRLYWSNLCRFVVPHSGSGANTMLDLYAKISPVFSDHGLSPLVYPVIDTLIRGLPVSCLTGSFRVDITGLATEVSAVKSRIDTLAESYDCCFLPDSAYFLNGIIKSQFLTARKDVYWLNPMGFLHQYQSIHDGEFGFRDLPLLSRSDLAGVSEYIGMRFGGNANTDIDTSRVFRERASNLWPTKKCLLLHAFRDANNLYWSEDQPFTSFIEWLDFTLNIITSEADAANWYIRPHPSAHLYENDSEILDFYLLKYGFAPTASCKGPTLLQILNEQMPIYTCTGSVILEAPIYGYKSFFCGPRFPERYGSYAHSKHTWETYLKMDTKSAQDFSIFAGESLRNLSMQALYLMYGRRPLARICPDRAIMPQDSGLDYVKSGLSGLINIIKCF